jgi:hypothetical protein
MNCIRVFVGATRFARDILTHLTKKVMESTKKKTKIVRPDKKFDPSPHSILEFTPLVFF